jgi:hypothetical protein
MGVYLFIYLFIYIRLKYIIHVGIQYILRLFQLEANSPKWLLLNFVARLQFSCR